MAAENERFTVRIQTMTGKLIEVPNIYMGHSVIMLKAKVARMLAASANATRDIDRIHLIYMDRDKGRFIELMHGKLIEYDIDFLDPNTELKMVVGESRETYRDDAASQKLASILSDPTNLVSISPNVAVVDEISPELNFKRIFILQNPNDQKGLSCTVNYISPTLLNNDGSVYHTIVIDSNKPEIRLVNLIHTQSFLHPYVINGRVLVEEPVYGGRKKRTRRTRRTLLKRRTHRKRRNHRRMSR